MLPYTGINKKSCILWIYRQIVWLQISLALHLASVFNSYWFQTYDKWTYMSLRMTQLGVWVIWAARSIRCEMAKALRESNSLNNNSSCLLERVVKSTVKICSGVINKDDWSMFYSKILFQSFCFKMSHYSVCYCHCFVIICEIYQPFLNENSFKANLTPIFFFQCMIQESRTRFHLTTLYLLFDRTGLFQENRSVWKSWLSVHWKVKIN